MRSETAPFPKGKSTQEQARKTKPAAIYVSSNGTLMAEEEEKDEGEQKEMGGEEENEEDLPAILTADRVLPRKRAPSPPPAEGLDT